MQGLNQETIRLALANLQEACHGNAVAKGFHDDMGKILSYVANGPDDVKEAERLQKVVTLLNIGQKLALIHSEVSEGLEGTRKDKMDDHLPHRTMLEVELADAVIRIFDLAGMEKMDLAGAILEKMAYNSGRPFMHGKNF